MFEKLFNKKSDDTVTFDKREFVLFSMVSAFRAGIPGEFSAYQMKLFSHAFGVDLEGIVNNITVEEFNRAEVRFDAALNRCEEN